MARSRRRVTPKSVVTVDVEGLDEAIEAIKKLPAALQKKLVAAGLTAAGAALLEEEARFVPIRSGALLRSLQVYAVRKGKRISRVFVGAGPEGFYGRYLEWGTQHMPAQPWLRPALDASFRPVVERFADTVEAGLDPVVDALARDAKARP